jgi:hypothetical protein
MGLPTDLWVPVTTRLPPQLSYQFSAGVSYSPDQTMEASAEIYYKSMKHVIEYKEGMGFNNYSYTSWEDLVELGKGNTYGSEWLLQKRKGKLTGLIGYTLSWSNRKFPHVNGGKTFPYKYDRRHELKMAIVWKVSKRVEFSSDWLFATGNSVTLPVAYYKDPYTGRTIDIYSGRNDFRLPVYHRLDVSGKFSKQKKKFIRTWIVGVYNVYNRKNPFYLYSRMEFQNGTLSKNTYRRVSLFPILPFITYQFKF